MILSPLEAVPDARTHAKNSRGNKFVDWLARPSKGVAGAQAELGDSPRP